MAKRLNMHKFNNQCVRSRKHPLTLTDSNKLLGKNRRSPTSFLQNRETEQKSERRCDEVIANSQTANKTYFIQSFLQRSSPSGELISSHAVTLMKQLLQTSENMSKTLLSEPHRHALNTSTKYTKEIENKHFIRMF